MKNQIDMNVANQKIQHFLDWLFQKSSLSASSDKVMVRDIIFSLQTFAPTADTQINLDINSVKSIYNLVFDLAYEIVLILSPEFKQSDFLNILYHRLTTSDPKPFSLHINPSSGSSDQISSLGGSNFAIVCELNSDFKEKLKQILISSQTTRHYDADGIVCALGCFSLLTSSDLKTALKNIREQFQYEIGSSYHKARFYQIDRLNNWWKSHGLDWTERLKFIAINYFDIRRDWQLDQAQYILIMNYYKANTLLVKLLNSTVVNRKVRQEIIESLLLPIAEIEKRNREKAE